MIKTPIKKLIKIPCKNKLTGRKEDFYVLAYNFAQAKWLLEFDLYTGWVIGHESM